MFALPTINGVIQVVQSFVDYFAAALGDELLIHLAKMSNGIFDDKEITISLGEPLTKKRFTLDEMKKNSEWFYELGDFIPKKIKDGTYKLGNKTINMFKPGDRIIQEGGILGLHNFSAEVVEHYPIVIENGMILQNKVRVKGCRGEYLNISQKSLNSSTVPIIRSIAKEEIAPKDLAIFRSDTLEKPVQRMGTPFWATMKEGDALLKEIIPNDSMGQLIRTSTHASSHQDFNTTLNILLGSNDSEAIVRSYENFFSNLKKGMIVDHKYLRIGDLSDSDFSKGQWFKDTQFRFNYGKLTEIVPDLGIHLSLIHI